MFKVKIEIVLIVLMSFILLKPISLRENQPIAFYDEYGKRMFDILLSIVGFIILIPVFIIISVLIKLNGDKGPILFTQERIGKNYMPFTIYKFRTMLVDAPSLGPGVTLPNDNRVTSLGRLLRKYKLDELPQLINVIKGDMSIVGPRPLIGSQVDEYKEEYSHILQIKPGLTDYAILKFRNEEEILAKYKNAEDAYINLILPDKIKLCKKYLNEKSLIVDLKMVYTTMVHLIRA